MSWLLWLAILASVVAAKPSFELRITAAPPLIDGQLHDDCWSSDQAMITDFRQVAPLEDAAPTERTEVRITYDADNLYIAVRCFDQEADKIIAKEMQHDRDTDSDDMVRVVLDTFNRQNDGYYFSLTAGGAKLEGLVKDNDTKVPEWDTVWHGRSRIAGKAWTAEFSIPMKSLAFNPAGDSWGFNIERIIRRKQEIVRWAGFSRVKEVTALSDMGEITGITGLRQGHGLEFRPFTSVNFAPLRSRRNDPKWDLKPGFDLTWYATPSLAATLTVNTDFAEADVDERQMNLTRFSISYPEKRNFFLQDSSLFAFGTNNNEGWSPSRPYYSRSIGLTADGHPVDILGGVKVAGRLGPGTVGLIDAQIDETSTVKSKNLLVARSTLDVFGESNVGVILTNGDPRTNGNSTTVGGDFNYLNSYLANGKSVDAHLWLLGTDSDLAGERDYLVAGELNYPNEPFSICLSGQRIGEDFDPALGFSPRPGTWQFKGSADYVVHRKTGLVRKVTVSTAPFLATDLDGHSQSLNTNLAKFLFENAAGDSIYVIWNTLSERLDEPFQIYKGVVIRPGNYRFSRSVVDIATTRGRPWRGGIQVRGGSHYAGHIRYYQGNVEWRPSSHLYMGLNYTLQEIRLPEGSFAARLGNFALNYTFSPNLSLNTFLQYDNKSRLFGTHLRLKWIVQPGNEVFLVLNQNYTNPEEWHLRPVDSRVSTKVAWTLRF
ncbi:MAG: carbohydrate binding family 9 domain-containing protein [Opitutaceae bacterium]|nr:carbohydrate binding family 9 domain-containing protein [Opitutaceae bacterium]